MSGGITGLGPYSTDCLDAFETLELDDETVKRIHDAPHQKFSSLGEIGLMGGAVAAGIKKRHVWDVGKRVANELYLADRLLALFPARSNSLPLLTYAVRTQDGQNVGILTEDFTRNGTRILGETSNSFGLSERRGREQTPEGLHRDVYDALNGRVYPEAFRHMIGFAFDREVLIDFDDVAFPPDEDLQAYKSLVESMVVVIPNDF